jgi:sugar lactone lactonase YvrE
MPSKAASGVNSDPAAGAVGTITKPVAKPRSKKKWIALAAVAVVLMSAVGTTLLLWDRLMGEGTNDFAVYTFVTLAGKAPTSGMLDGTGVAARFGAPFGVAMDGAGNLYVPDSTNNNTVIRKVTPAGVVTTLTGLREASGGATHFGWPCSLAVDEPGNIFIADKNACTVRKVTPAGVVTTIAGLEGARGSADGAGEVARFYLPSGVAVDRAGNVYVSDQGNYTIRKITPAGMVTTLAGTAGAPGPVDGTGKAARFFGPSGLAVDGAGNIYVADQSNFTIRKITPAGVVTTLAGRAGSQGSMDGTGSAARFNSPTGVAVDREGRVYVADARDETIRKITPSGVVTTLGGFPGRSGDTDGRGSAARFRTPCGVAVDGAGNVYVADQNNHTLRKGVPAKIKEKKAPQSSSKGPKK